MNDVFTHCPDALLPLPLPRSALLEPVHLSSPAPWAGHIPFAAWLMAVMRPRTLVELGVYSGISYLAFCQAAQQHGVGLRALGVDTWQGDEHAGHYDGARILQTLREHHDARYGHFSTLLQKTFDEALADVADGSVDLLHIDGLHTYEAVRHDFESWKGKLSERAVVLFHDTAVRTGDFGVWRYWQELSERFDALSFEHSNGLGVLLVGPQAPQCLRALAADTESGHWAQVREAFAALGERLELRAQQMHLSVQLSDWQSKSQAQHAWIEQQDAQLLALQQKSDAQLRQLQQQHATDEESIGTLQHTLQQRDAQLLALQQQSDGQRQWIEQQDAQLRQLQQQRQVDEGSIGTLQRTLEQRNAQLVALQQQSDEQREWNAQQDAQLRQLQRMLEQRDAQLAALQQQHEADEKSLAELNQRTQALAQCRLELEETTRAQQREIRDWHRRLGDVTRQSRRISQQLQAERLQTRSLQAQVDDMLQSRSWRLTAGLRWLGRHARRLRASAVGQRLTTGARRARNALRYAAAGNWRELWQRMRHVRQQAEQVQRMQQFEGQQEVRCGILATPHTWFVAHGLQAALARAGLAAHIVTEAEDDVYPLELYFVVCPQMFKHLPPGEKRIAFQMEQTVSSRWFTPDYLAVLENSLAALDYARTNVANLAEYGIVYPHVFLTPIGGIAHYATWGGKAAAQADEHCDVLFYGDANAPRRRRLLDAIARRFKLRIVGNAFGEEMQRALAGAKVVVNLHYYEGALLETTRIYECLSLGKAVVSECAADQAEHADLEGVVRFVAIDDVNALLSALQEAVQEQSEPQSRAAWLARCEAQVAASQARFGFMLYRMLLARRVIDYPRFAELTGESQALAPRVALSLPETTERRDAFEQVRPADVQVFDGLRYAPGWVGCALSYKYLAQLALQQNLPQLEIMEDDVEFLPDYDQRRARVNAWLQSRQGQWDVFVGVMALVHPDTRVLDVQRVDGETYVTIDRMISMVCNVYTPRALARMAAWDESWQDAEANTVDRFLQTQGDLRVVVTLPFLVGHREDAHSSLWGIANTRYTQMIAQAQEQLMALAEAFDAQAPETLL